MSVFLNNNDVVDASFDQSQPEGGRRTKTEKIENECEKLFVWGQVVI
jgi:hypothetical protein